MKTTIETLLRSPDIKDFYLHLCQQYGQATGDRYLSVLVSIGDRPERASTCPQKEHARGHSDEAKQKVREAIAQLGPCRYSQITQRLLRMQVRLSKNTLEHYLKEMRMDGSIQAEKTGRKFLYSVAKEAIAS